MHHGVLGETLHWKKPVVRIYFKWSNGNLVGIIVRSAESGNVFHLIFGYRLLIMSAQFKNMSKS